MITADQYRLAIAITLLLIAAALLYPRRSK